MVVKPSMACSRPMTAVNSSGGAAAAGALDGFDGVADAVDAVADGVRKVAVEEQKLQDAIGRKVGGVDLAVGLEGGAAAQQAHQLKILIAGVFALLRVNRSAGRPRAAWRWHRRAPDSGPGG
jgi:hypothetical protein